MARWKVIENGKTVNIIVADAPIPGINMTPDDGEIITHVGEVDNMPSIDDQIAALTEAVLTGNKTKLSAADTKLRSKGKR